MQAIILIGVQASGKSTFYGERFSSTHVRINLDMLNTRHREQEFLRVCFATRQSFVVDNSNPTREDRQRYIGHAKQAGFRVIGFYFQSQVRECKNRNDRRHPDDRVPLPGLLATYARIELPRLDEGFDELYYVKIGEFGFEVEGWKNEV